MAAIHKHFSSLQAYQYFLDKEVNYSYQAADRPDRERHTHSDFYNGTIDAGIKVITAGDNELGERAAQLASKLLVQLPRVHQHWETNVVGMFPNVPAYLAGVPDTMYTLAPEESERSPVRVWIGVTSSAVIAPAMLADRGAALTAFAIALSELRSVTLTPYVCTSNSSRPDGAYISWDISTSPLVHSLIAANLARPDVIRGAGLGATAHLLKQYAGQFPTHSFHEAQCRNILGCATDDIWLPPIHVDDPLLKEPVKWITAHIAKLSDPEYIYAADYAHGV